MQCSIQILFNRNVSKKKNYNRVAHRDLLRDKSLIVADASRYNDNSKLARRKPCILHCKKQLSSCNKLQSFVTKIDLGILVFEFNFLLIIDLLCECGRYSIIEWMNKWNVDFHKSVALFNKICFEEHFKGLKLCLYAQKKIYCQNIR